MLANMSEIDPRAEMPLVDWSELGVSGLLPTGTVTLLLADVEGSTRLWETQPDEMTTAIARLNSVVSNVIATHDGVRPVEQGEGDSFVAAFARASDAVAEISGLTRQRSAFLPTNTGSKTLTQLGPTTSGHDGCMGTLVSSWRVRGQLASNIWAPAPTAHERAGPGAHHVVERYRSEARRAQQL